METGRLVGVVMSRLVLLFPFYWMSSGKVYRSQSYVTIGKSRETVYSAPLKFGYLIRLIVANTPFFYSIFLEIFICVA